MLSKIVVIVLSIYNKLTTRIYALLPEMLVVDDSGVSAFDNNNSSNEGG